MHAPLNHSENIAPCGIDESRVQERLKLALFIHNFQFIGLFLRWSMHLYNKNIAERIALIHYLA